MASNDRRASLSPREQQRTKSQSSSRSHRTTPNITVYEDGIQQEKLSLPTSRRSTREAIPTKRSESSTSNRSTTATSPTSNVSRKGRISLKSSSSPPITTNRRKSSKGKKSSVSSSEIERKQLPEPNDSEKQDLSTRGLSIVPPDIFEFITLRRLILSNNNLAGLPSSIGSLINLEYLDISNNPLIVRNGHDDYTCLPREFRYLKNLQTLIIGQCTLKDIPVAVWNTTSLQTLDLNRNAVGYIVSDIGNLTDIRHLRLSHMDLDTLPPEIGFCDKLETMDLTGNPIDTLPETLVECRQLYELKINYKNFYKILDSYMLQLIHEGKIRSEHIPQVIFELENLNILDLNQTKINSISNEQTLLNLTELYLSKNSFFDIPESICTIEQLKILDMSHNRINFIPEYFNQMKQLEKINFSFNRLTILSRIFTKLLLLKKLNLSHNKIDRIENEFSQNKSILTLDLSNNHLKDIPNQLCELQQLETLDLRYNKLEYLPSTIRRMIGLKSMNTFDNTFHRTGLHLLGNSIIDPPGYIWKSTNIQTLLNYIETKEKNLSSNYYHLKLIVLGPKNIGKTAFVIKLVNNRKIISNTKKTLDMFVSILEEKQLKTNEIKRQISNDGASSILTDQWIENRYSTNEDYSNNRHLKIKRIYPPPIKTYRSKELSNYIIQKSVIITENNFYFTIFDLTNEPNYEILYPLIYDTNALYILPINLTILLTILQNATNLENENQSSSSSSTTIINFDILLTQDWLYSHIFRYLESISDYCDEVFIAIIGLIDNSQIESNDQQAQQLLEEIHLRIDKFLSEIRTQRNNINIYSEFFPKPLYLDDENMSLLVLKQLEIIAQQWNIKHDKKKQESIKKYFNFIQQNELIIDYDTFLKRFQQHTSLILEHKQKEFNQISFDEYIDYLKLIGDIFCFGQKSNRIILLKPYYLLNKIFSNTLFRPNIDQWLNYEDNMVFHFSGYYSSKDLFDIDRQRLLLRGEFTWKMLNVLFYEQNNTDIGLTEQNILDYCYLMERLYLGYINQSNLTYREFTTIYFVCPWLMNEICSNNIDYINYFKSLEQERKYEQLQCERTRLIKQQQLWFSMDNEQDNTQNKYSLEINEIISMKIPDLPLIDEINISNSKIINQDDLIQKIIILNKNFNFLPNGLYERLLICLHSLFNERLDYYNLTVGRTIDRNLIQIQRFDEQKQIHLTINKNLFERIENLLLHNLFLFYPNGNLQIET